jgi:ribosome-binding factor A
MQLAPRPPEETDTVANKGSIPKRTLQIAEQIRNHVALSIVTGEVADPRLRSVTLTRSTVTRDLQHADIWYSVLGDQETAKAAEKALRGAAGYFRSSLGRALGLRYTPALRFRFDEGIVHSDRIARLLQGVMGTGMAQSSQDSEAFAVPQSTSTTPQNIPTQNSTAQ